MASDDEAKLVALRALAAAIRAENTLLRERIRALEAELVALQESVTE